MKVTIDTEDIDVLRRAVGLDAEECLLIIRRAAVELLSIGESAFWSIPDMEEGDLLRSNPALHKLPGWPHCACGAPATATDDAGKPVCALGAPIMLIKQPQKRGFFRKFRKWRHSHER